MSVPGSRGLDKCVKCHSHTLANKSRKSCWVKVLEGRHNDVTWNVLAGGESIARWRWQRMCQLRADEDRRAVGAPGAALGARL